MRYVRFLIAGWLNSVCAWTPAGQRNPGTVKTGSVCLEECWHTTRPQSGLAGEVVKVAAHPADVAVRRPTDPCRGVARYPGAEVVVQPVEVQGQHSGRHLLHHRGRERHLV